MNVLKNTYPQRIGRSRYHTRENLVIIHFHDQIRIYTSIERCLTWQFPVCVGYCVCVCIFLNRRIRRNRRRKTYFAPTTFNFSTLIFFGRGVALLLVHKNLLEEVHKNFLKKERVTALLRRIIFWILFFEILKFFG